MHHAYIPHHLPYHLSCMVKKILFISWSPKHGETDRVLSYIFDRVEGEKEMLLLREKKLDHCLWCWACKEIGTCILEDDMQEIREKLMKANLIVLWSPNHFANVSSLTKTFIDKTFPLYHSLSLKWKEIFLIMTGHSADDTNKKYMNQGTFGFVHYQNMKLLQTYGIKTKDIYSSEPPEIPEKRLQLIVSQISKHINKISL